MRVRASIPVAAVTPGGAVRVSSGSTMATAGIMYGETIPSFTCVRVLVKMALGVASAPVPAVVGMAITGSPGRGTRSTPK